MTFDHEAVHALKALGLFNTAEWNALTNEASRDAALMTSIRQRYQHLSAKAQTEEAVADLFMRYRAGQEVKGFARKALDRIPDLLREAVPVHSQIGRASLQKHDFYAAARMISGDLRRVKIVVNESPTGLLMYSQHIILPLEPVVGDGAPGSEAGKDAKASTLGTPGTTISLRDLLHGVKNSDGTRIFGSGDAKHSIPTALPDAGHNFHNIETEVSQDQIGRIYRANLSCHVRFKRAVYRGAVMGTLISY